MAREKEVVTISGGRAQRFREIREEIEDQVGYEPSKPEVIGRMMEHFPDE